MLRMKNLITATIILISTINFCNAQSNCNKTFGVACYGSGNDEYSKTDAPESFYSGTRGITIGVTYQGFTAPAQTAFDFSKQIWESILNGTVPIKVNAYFLPIGAGGSLAITFPNGRKNFAGAIVNDVWYPTSLANQLSGTELNTGESDFDIFLNSSVNWYFGTDGICPIGKYDFVSVALHEICHGLGLVGLSKVDSLGIGSLGTLTINDFSPAITSFPWPELDTFPGIFDHFLMTFDGTPIANGAFLNPSDTLADILTSNQIYWFGINGLQYNNNLEPRIYSPATFALGSSMVHLNEATYPTGNENELMTPFANSHSSNHNPGPIALAILKDIGWDVDPDFNNIEELISGSNFQIFPNPSADFISWNFKNNEEGEIVIKDLIGRILIQKSDLNSERRIDISELRSGLYTIELKTKTSTHVSRFVKN